jgi:hypoxanthine phosphoribosyltransferase
LAERAGGGVRDLSFDEISQRLRTFALPEVDVVVGVLRGGRVPAMLVAHQLGVPLRFIRVSHRDDANVPLRDEPDQRGTVPEVAGRVLLVDDVSVTGKSLQVAAAALPVGTVITTLVLKGRREAADLVVFDDIPECVRWPWA